MAGQPVKWPESTTTARSAGSRSSSATAQLTRVDEAVGRRRPRRGWSRQPPAAIRSRTSGVRNPLLRCAAGGELGRERLGGGARVTGDAEVGGQVGADRGRVEVDLHDAGARRRSVARGGSSSG